MKFQSFRSAVVVASVIIGSVIPSQAFAQFDVLTCGLVGGVKDAGTASYRFTDSMILNSIGFVTDGQTPVSLSYTLKGNQYKLGNHFTLLNLSAEENGFRWLTISPQSMVLNEIVTVTTEFSAVGYSSASRYRYCTGPNPNTNVVFLGFDAPDDGNYTDLTNSNLRVSALGANVAPEPGTLALALTGGCALLGMYIRRRRAA